MDAELKTRKHNYLLLFSVFFCWFFAVMISYTSLGSPDRLEVVLKAVITGLGLWCGLGLLKRRGQVLWFAVALCLYAVLGSFFWLYNSIAVPLFNGQVVSYGFYDFLGVLYILCGSLVIWFLLHERTRGYLDNN